MWRFPLTSRLVPLARGQEGTDTPEEGPDYGPAEDGQGIDAYQLPDKGQVAVLQDRRDLRPHQIRVLFPEVPQVKTRGEIGKRI